jgi:DNA-directed RNA polymerase specialized sigma24 family protein
LLERLVEAVWQDDRAEFDRLFDRCFGQIYGVAWRVTRDRARAEILAARILCEATIRAT